jgi:hydroxymethylglutaryl-CoA lyase
MHFPPVIEIVEVGPRDGLQSFSRWVDTDTKVAMVDLLSEVGFPTIEVTSFASPKAVPYLTDAEEVMTRIKRRKGTKYRVLVPNARGAERAVASRPDEILGLLTISETYLRKNQNMSLGQAVEQAISAFRIADRNGIGFVMAIGVSLWCSYEGKIPLEKVLAVGTELHNGGIRNLSIAGSMGMEDPRHVGALFSQLYDRHPDLKLGYHVHNLSGWATANVLAALDAGAVWIEGSICGLGGGIAMPSSLGAIGNLATEDVAAFLESMGIETGLELDQLIVASEAVAELLKIMPRSHAANGVTRQRILASNAAFARRDAAKASL